MISFAQALTTENKNALANELIAGLTGEGIDVAGLGDYSVARGLVELQARAAEFQEKLRVVVVKAGLLRLAPEAGDEWVDMLAENVFDEKRIPAVRTQGTLRLSCSPTAGPYTVALGTFVAQADSGVLYNNINTDHPNLAPGASVEVLFEAQTPGIVGNATTGSLKKLVVAQPGVTASNWHLTKAGRDKETNMALVVRLLSKWGTLGAAGNRFAYNYRIPQAADTVTRWHVRDDNPGGSGYLGAGTVHVYLANAAGPAGVDELVAVNTYLQERKALGTGELSVFPATSADAIVRARLLTDGTNPKAAEQAAEALLRLAANYPLGQKLYRNELIETMMGVASVVNVEDFTLPSTDVELASSDVLNIIPQVTQV